jgi:hypothetical protein
MTMANQQDRTVDIDGRPVTLTAGPDQRPGELARDRQGNVIDDGYVTTVLEEIATAKAAPGRPSLSTHGVSPLIQFRIPREVKDAIDAAARGRGVSTSQWLRHAVEHELQRDAG